MDTAVTIEEAKADRQARTHRLADGRTIGYAEYGAPQGQAVIALHGTPGSRLIFAFTGAAARDRGLRIIAPDRPGYGLSDFRPCQSLTQSAEDARALADALALDRFALIGVSGGAPFAIALAATMGDRVQLLALVGPVGPVADCRDRILMTRLQRLVFARMGRSRLACTLFFSTLRTFVELAPETAYRGLMRRAIHADRIVLQHPEVKASLLASIDEALKPGVKGAVQDLCLYCAPWDLDLAAVDRPSVLWQGSDDVIVPREAAFHLASALPNCRLHIVPRAGHYWPYRQFEPILDAVAASLRAA
jgi:pimeloyl-ACP methyl ester carboxylesterase